MGPAATILPDGKRLHLQHGPIDLVIGADGEREEAFEAAHVRFLTVLDELVEELPALRRKLLATTPEPANAVARRMHEATLPFLRFGYLTRMAAVAGAVSDEVLDAMRGACSLRRAYVNNGGDIALHLAQGETFRTGVRDHAGQALGEIALTAKDGIGGIATSGRHGRSHSLGIADSVTVLGNDAATADVAATMIANAVDLPGHPAIVRRPASEIDDQNDLGDLPVVTSCGTLYRSDCATALQNGLGQAESFANTGLIESAALFLQGQSEVTNGQFFALQHRDPEHD